MKNVDFKIKQITDETLGDFPNLNIQYCLGTIDYDLNKDKYEVVETGQFDIESYIRNNKEFSSIEERNLEICEQAFEYYQNIERLIKMRSLSCGDVICIEGKEYMCKPLSFELVGGDTNGSSIKTIKLSAKS